MAKLFRCRVVEPAVPQGSIEVLFNVEQFVFVFRNPDDPDTCFVRMTGEANVFILLSAYEHVRDEIESLLA